MAIRESKLDLVELKKRSVEARERISKWPKWLQETVRFVSYPFPKSIEERK